MVKEATLNKNLENVFCNNNNNNNDKAVCALSTESQEC